MYRIVMHKNGSSIKKKHRFFHFRDQTAHDVSTTSTQNYYDDFNGRVVSAQLIRNSIDWFLNDRGDLRSERIDLSPVKLICFKRGNHYKVYALIKFYFQAVEKLPAKETLSC